MAIVFSTRDVHPRERLSCWRETMGLVRHEFDSSAGSAFLGSVRSEWLDGLLVSEFKCDPCEVRRTAANIAHADCDDFILCIQLSGRAIFAQDGREAIAENGGFALLDPRRPFAVSYQGRTRSVGMSLPRQALEARLGDMTALTARTMEGHRPLAGLAAGFVCMLPQRMEALTPVARSRVAEQALDLIALAYSVECCRANPVLSSVRATSLFRLKSAIERRLSEPDLKPATVAAAAGMSVRYANDLLSKEGFSVERYILHRRLDRCRCALEDPQQAHRAIGEIAFGWGFSDLSHFGRRFRAAYGCAAGDYRRRMLETVLGERAAISALHEMISTAK